MAMPATTPLTVTTLGKRIGARIDGVLLAATSMRPWWGIFTRHCCDTR